MPSLRAHCAPRSTSGVTHRRSSRPRCAVGNVGDDPVAWNERGRLAPPSLSYSPRLLAARAFALAARAATASAPTALPPGTAVLAGLAWRGVLRPLDELLGGDHLLALVLLDELEADPAARLVHFLHDDVEDVAALDDVLDVVDASRAHVRDVEQAVGPLLQLDERTEVGRLHDATG